MNEKRKSDKTDYTHEGENEVREGKKENIWKERRQTQKQNMKVRKHSMNE